MEQVLVELEDRIDRAIKEIKARRLEIEALKAERASFDKKVSALEQSVREQAGIKEKQDTELKERLSLFSNKIGTAIKQLDSVI